VEAENRLRQAGKIRREKSLNIFVSFCVLYMSSETGTGRVFGFPTRSTDQTQGLVSLVVGRADAAMASALFIGPALFSPGIEAFSVIMACTYTSSTGFTKLNDKRA